VVNVSATCVTDQKLFQVSIHNDILYSSYIVHVYIHTNVFNKINN
jgi:hypothetical protein